MTAEREDVVPVRRDAGRPGPADRRFNGGRAHHDPAAMSLPSPKSVRWTTVVPLLSAVALAVTWGSKPGTAVLAVSGALLAACVLAAVHHAEVVAHRVGEPFGSLILAVAVTVITLNGIVGISLLVATLRDGSRRSGPTARRPR
jgi:hypothetical protein